jgi:ubiquinone/menaquinone biosynthesis C-methylase UbiE
MPEPICDQWAQWLLQRRHGGDPAQQQRDLAGLAQVRDHVLRNATIAAEDVVLDVGTGDGLMAFGALAQVGAQGQVIFSDISQDCLEHCRALAQQMGVVEQCQFLRASADDLSALGEASVDVVTTRSVLIYVATKPQAFREFYRVLKPGGRLSIFEPINRYFGMPGPPRYEVGPIQEIWHKIRAVDERKQPSKTYPMLDFDERDLLSFAEQAGFREIGLELRVTVMPVRPQRWEVWLRSAPNPLAPTFEEVMQEALTPEEIARCVAHLRPLVEAGQGTRRDALASLWAVKR